MKNVSKVVSSGARLLILVFSILVVGQLSAQTEINSYAASDTLIKWEDMADYLPTEVITLAGEDEVYTIALPFSFQFFNNTYTEAFVSMNGNVTFGRSYQGGDFNREKLCKPVAWDYDPTREQDALNPDNFIAVYWDDLFLDPGCTIFGTPKLTQRVIGTAPDREYIITYDYFVRSADTAPCQDPSYGGVLQAQVRLHETTNIIEVHHFSNRLSQDGLPTVGVENLDGTYANYALCGTDSFPPEQAAWVFYPSEVIVVDTVVTPPSTGYCDASGPADCADADALIEKVTLDAFTNTSASCPNGTGPTYIDYTNLFAEYTLGSDVTALVTIDGFGYETVDIYIDWNKDGDFDDTGETFNGVNVNGDATVDILSAVVPEETSQGITRMRVRVYDAAFGLGPFGPCGASRYGEVEDYSIIIIDPNGVQCTNLISPAADAIDVCTMTQLAWNSVADADSYEVLLTFSNGDTATNIIVNDTVFNLVSLLPDTSYNWSITPRDSNNVKAVGCAPQSFSTTPFSNVSILFANDTVSFCEGVGATLMPSILKGNGSILYNWTGDVGFLDDVSSATPLFTDTNAGVYTLYLAVSDSLNCSSNDSVVVEVYDAPELSSFSFTSKDICPGDSVGIEVETSNSIKFLDLQNGIYTELTPSSIDNSVIYFNAVDTDLIFNAVINTALCRDTILMDTVVFYADVAQPTILVELPSVGPCEGDSVLLISSYSSDIEWIDGTVNDSLYIKTFRQEAVEYTFGNGFCTSTSDIVEVAFDMYPSAPILSADKVSFCAGDSAIVGHNYVGDFIWSNGDMVNTSFAVFVTDSFSVKVLSPLGCETLSDTIYLTTNPNPTKPEFTVSGLENELCEGDLLTVSTQNTNTLEWSTGESSSSIVVNQDSDIWLKAINSFACSTNSDTVVIIFGEQPDRPDIIKIEGATMDSLQCSEVGASYNWFFNGQPIQFTTQTIPLPLSGLYRVSVIGDNGCVSELSSGFSNVGIIELAHAGIKVLNTRSEWIIESETKIQQAVLFDATGREIQEFENTSTIHIYKDTNNSLLILKMEVNGQMFSLKLNY